MKKLLLNTDWQFTDFQTQEQKTVCLPHDATIGSDRDPDIRIGYLSAFYHGGTYEYIKTFVVPKEWKGKTVYFEAEGIYRNVTITVNGNKISSFVNGYMGICERIDMFLQYGGENTVAVKIETPYNDHVFLYVGETAHIAPHGVKITTLSYSPAVIQVDTDVCGEGDVAVSVLDGETVVATGSGMSTQITVPHAKLWSDETPHLYTVAVTLTKNGKVVDETAERFGIRTLAWNAEQGFSVNGKRTLLRGGCIHCDNGILGTVTTRRTELRRAKKIKAAGFNAIRSAHHSISPALLEACDEVGLFVMDETFDSWYRMKTRNDFSSAFYSEYERVLTAMAEKDYNHPSVIMYSIGNEIPEIGSLKGIRFGKDMIRILKEIDKTRPVLLCPSMRLAKDFLYGMPYDTVEEDEYLSDPENAKKDFEHYVKVWTRGLKNELSVFEYTDERKEQDERATRELYDALDIAGYNYYGEYYEDLHAVHPERVILGTETESNKLSYHYAKMKELPYVIGDFVWTLQDHLGECNCCELRYEEEQSDKSYPWINNWCGKLDLIGNENITAHRYRMVWGLEHGIVLAAQPPVHNGVEAKFNNDRETDTVMSWTFEGCEGNKTYIDVVSDAPVVEVVQNGKTLGKQQTKDYAARFFTEYIPGIVEAIGYSENGKVLYKEKLCTADKETVISVRADKTKLFADGQDMCFLEIAVTDGKDNIKALPDHKIEVKVDGAGYLAALGSAAYKTEEKYTENVCTTFEGKCLAVLRSKTRVGKIQVTVLCDGIPQKILDIEAAK